MEDEQNAKMDDEKSYLKAGTFIESERVPKSLWGKTIVATLRNDVTRDNRFTVIDENGKNVLDEHGKAIFFGIDAYKMVVVKGCVNHNGVDLNAVSKEPTPERLAPEETDLTPTCEGMDRIADIEVQRTLYHDPQSDQFYWDDNGVAKVVPWEQVSHHVVAGDMRYETDEDERRLMRLLMESERQAYRHRGGETEETDDETDEGETEDGRRGGRILAFVMLLLGIAVGYGLALALSH